MKIKFPSIYLITGLNPKKPEDFLAKLENHLTRGIQLIQLRAKELSEEEYEILAINVLELGKKYSAQILLNTNVQTANKLQAEGIHLTSNLLMQLRQRPFSKKVLLSAACHNENELMHAEKIGIDFVTLSPILQTQTHPQATPLGWDQFHKLSQLIKLPIYALGGMSENDLVTAKAHGAYGIAAINSLWNETVLF